MFLLRSIFVANIFSAFSEANQNPIVKTDYGEIEGFSFKTSEGFETEMFLGIPYAKPPIGDLRFEKPEPPIPWNTTLQANKFGAPCATYPNFLAPHGSENCLTLNIIRPKLFNPSGYTVMVWIHGGAFLVGSSSNYNQNETASRIVSKGVIFISINYRLGPFGFFSTGDSEAPGNYGIWDQIEALKFIQKIVEAFGGNKSSVTIFGESSGGASVSWLTLIPEAQVLFAKAIPMSGSALSPWAHTEEIVKTSKKLILATTNCRHKNIKQCLKEKTTEDIQKATATFAKHILKSDGINLAHFHPRLEGELLKGMNFEEAIKKAPKREHFMGICSQENILFAIIGLFNDPKTKLLPISKTVATNFSRGNFVEIVHKILGPEYGNEANEAVEDIINFYEKTQISFYSRNIYLHLYVQLFSDISFNIPAIREAKLKAKAGQKVYFYLYSFVPDLLIHEFLDGAGHSSELSNFFGSSLLSPAALPLKGEVAKVQKITLDLFINFAKTGIPSSKGLKVPSLTSSTETPYVEINTDTKIMENLWADRMKFWEKHSKKYGFDWPQYRKIEKHDEL
uniref:Carboxylic ester hydrolase n=1 Tax=Panagrolaimus sp. ES5 TaxID=591445 RepID=A0AC34F714_9BILA